jgi:hypothetical protein
VGIVIQGQPQQATCPPASRENCRVSSSARATVSSLFDKDVDRAIRPAKLEKLDRNAERPGGLLTLWTPPPITQANHLVRSEALSAEKSQHSAGWYAGALVFWLLSAWLITVGLSSIIPQIFSPVGDPAPSASSCAPALRALRSELLDRTGQTIANAGKGGAWLADWDKRLYSARPNCTDSERPAFTELNRLRHGLGALSERFEREELPHLERLDELLGPAPEHASALPQKNIHE